MKKFLPFLLFAATLHAQTTPVTGTIQGASGVPAGPNSFVEFTLVNCGTAQPMVNGVAVMLNAPVDFYPDANGNLVKQDGSAASLYGNDIIQCMGSGGSIGNTSRYSVAQFPNGQPAGPTKLYYVQTGVSFNLNTAQPVFVMPPLKYPNPTQCPAGTTQNGLNNDLSSKCLNLPSGAVNSVVVNPAGTQQVDQPAGTSVSIGSAAGRTTMDASGNLTANSITSNTSIHASSANIDGTISADTVAAASFTGPLDGVANGNVALAPPADQNVIQPGTTAAHFSNLNRVIDVSTYPGANCGAKLNAAIAAWGSNPVTFNVSTACGTSAWSNVTLQPGQNIHFVESGTYNVGAITLLGGNMVYGSGMNNTTLQPASGTMSCILCIAGTSSTNVFFFFVRDLTFSNNAATVTGSSAIQTNFTQFLYIEHVRFLNFDLNVNINNTFYVYAQNSYFNGGKSANFSMICCGPFYIDHNVFGASTNGPGINLLNAASGKISNNDVTQNNTYGISVSGTAPLPSGGVGDIEITNNTLDSNKDSAILLNNALESVVSGNWIASGRDVPGGRAGMQLINSANVSIANNKCYGSGTDCFDLTGNTSITMTGNVMGGTPGIGINVAATVNSSFVGNTCNGTVYQGFGSVMSWCVLESGSSANNTYASNSAPGMATGKYSLQQSSINLNVQPFGFMPLSTGTLSSISFSNLYSSVFMPVNAELLQLSVVAGNYSCSTPPTITLEDCGSSNTCASPTALANVQVTAANTITGLTPGATNLIAGRLYAWMITGGVCTSLSLNGSASYKPWN